MTEKDWGIIESKPADRVEPMLHKLQSLYGDKTLCDVTLRAGNCTIDAHKVILAISSDYFNAMFSGNWKESSGREIVLADMTAIGLKAVVEFIYCGKFYMYDENCKEIVSALRHCQLNQALRLCEDYLLEKVNEATFVDFFHLSDAFCLEHLRKAVSNFVAKNYMPNFPEKSFMLKGEILNADQNLFKCALFDWYDGPCACGFGPFVGIHCAIQWVEHDPEEREQYLSELLSHFAKRELDVAEVKELVEFYRTSIQKYDGQPEDSVLVGAVFGDLACFEPQSKTTWRRLPECPRGDDINHGWGTVVLENKLYVCGGLGSKSSDGTLADCYYYDPGLNCWFPMSPMLIPRRSFGLVGLKGELLALGGMSEDYSIEDSVDRYDRSLDCWSRGVPLPSPLSAHAAVAYKDKVYVTGGFCEIEGLGLKLTFCYDPETKSWDKKKGMIEGRLCHSMAAFRDHLYVFGGEDESDQLHSSVITEPFVECYSIEADTWTAIKLFSRPEEISVWSICSDGSSLFVLMNGWFSHEGDQVLERSDETGAMQVATIDVDTTTYSTLFLTLLKGCDDVTDLHLFHSLHIPPTVMKYMPVVDSFKR